MQYTTRFQGQGERQPQPSGVNDLIRTLFESRGKAGLFFRVFREKVDVSWLSYIRTRARSLAVRMHQCPQEAMMKPYRRADSYEEFEAIMDSIEGNGPQATLFALLKEACVLLPYPET